MIVYQELHQKTKIGFKRKKMNFINIKNQIENLNLRYPPIYNKKDHDKYVNDWREQYTGSTISLSLIHI